MGVKLTTGCYAVQRGHVEVIGPFKPWCGLDDFFEVQGVLGVFCEKGFHWLPGGECARMGLGPKPLILDPVKKAFPTESAARAWVNRKPLWAEALMWIRRLIVALCGITFIVFMAALAWLSFTSCAPNRPYPHGPRCTEDGAHTHTTNGDAKRPEGE